jgi:hypothetical protein
MGRSCKNPISPTHLRSIGDVVGGKRRLDATLLDTSIMPQKWRRNAPASHKIDETVEPTLLKS